MSIAAPSPTGALTLLVVALLTASPGAMVGTPVGSPQDGEPILSMLDTLARRPSISFTARRVLEAELVERGERGWMEVVTRRERGGVTHTIAAQGGSTRVRSRGLASVLAREIEAGRQDEVRRAAFSRENYRYRLLDAPWNTVRIELLPLRNDARLVRGTAVVDPGSGDLLSVEGELSANPSFWVRDVHVSRTYERVGGVTLPVDFVSTARVRLVGQARLRIRSTYLSVDGRPVGAAASTTLVRARDES